MINISFLTNNLQLQTAYNNITTLDVDDKTLEKIKSRVNSVKCVKSFIESLPFEGESYDVAIATQVIEHLINPIDGLKEMRRVIKMNGMMLITTPIEHKIPNHLHRHKFDLYDVVKLFHQLGDNFNIVEIHKWNEKRNYTDPNIFAINYKKGVMI